jgi:hypothetical protein
MESKSDTLCITKLYAAPGQSRAAIHGVPAQSRQWSQALQTGLLHASARCGVVLQVPTARVDHVEDGSMGGCETEPFLIGISTVQDVLSQVKEQASLRSYSEEVRWWRDVHSDDDR